MMGLSSMSTMDKNLRYAMRIYHRPSFGSWHEWFAWYPVRVVSFKEAKISYIGMTGYYLKYYRWTWLKKIARRKVVDHFDGPGRESAGSSNYYEYTTTMELLKSGY